MEEVKNNNNYKQMYWAMRTDRDKQEILFEELQAGRLRQGWGYEKEQDLRLIQKEKEAGNDWWSRLTGLQREAYPHYRMIGDDPHDSMHFGDIILLPNLPQNGMFCLAKIKGKYYYDIFHQTGDHGHILEVELLTPRGISKYNEKVPANIRTTLRARNRLWNLNYYKFEINELLDLVNAEEDLSFDTPEVERLPRALEIARNEAKKIFKAHFAKEVYKRFEGTEWHNPIIRALKVLYPNGCIEHTHGPKEQGADILMQLPNPFDQDGQPWLIPIQVKDRPAGPTDLQQIDQAYYHYSGQGKVVAAILATTAEEAAENFEEAKLKLEKEIGIPITLCLRERLIELLAKGFLLEQE